MIARVLAVLLAISAIVTAGLWADRSIKVRELSRAREEVSALKLAQATALARAQDRYIEREQQAKEAIDAYHKELAVPRPTPAPERLRDAISAAGYRDREAASTDCGGIQDRAATYRDLLDQADGLLGEGESLAAELSAAAEQHASEVRLLKSRAESDRKGIYTEPAP